MNKQFKLIKLIGTYFFTEEPKVMGRRTTLRVCNGHPLYQRKKVYKNYKDQAKRGLYIVKIKTKKEYLYEH